MPEAAFDSGVLTSQELEELRRAGLQQSEQAAEVFSRMNLSDTPRSPNSLSSTPTNSESVSRSKSSLIGSKEWYLEAELMELDQESEKEERSQDSQDGSAPD